MRTFIVEINKGGKWRKVTAVFPFSSGELLDERLDEAYVTFYSRTKEYRPLTEFRITHNVDGKQEGDIEYYILATDNSAEFPSGSGRYKHQVYLIERTKLLEGVVCPSLTFTNALQNTNRILGKKVKPTITGSALGLPGDFAEYGNIYSPSGSAKAFMLIPLIVPMAGMFGIPAQLCVLVFASGDGFSNVFYPTNPGLIISLGLAGTGYVKWAKNGAGNSRR